MYGMWRDILSNYDAGHMNARATLLNGKTVKENGGGTVVVREMQDNSEVLLEA
jgi:hypothetical protein